MVPHVSPNGTGMSASVVRSLRTSSVGDDGDVDAGLALAPGAGWPSVPPMAVRKRAWRPGGGDAEVGHPLAVEDRPDLGLAKRGVAADVDGARRVAGSPARPGTASLLERFGVVAEQPDVRRTLAPPPIKGDDLLARSWMPGMLALHLPNVLDDLEDGAVALAFSLSCTAIVPLRSLPPWREPPCPTVVVNDSISGRSRRRCSTRDIAALFAGEDVPGGISVLMVNWPSSSLGAYSWPMRFSGSVARMQDQQGDRP